MKIGNRIKEKREKMGISQTELANMVKISKQTLYKYENGIITNIPSDKIEAIASKLNVSASYLMGWNIEEIESTAKKDLALSKMSERMTEYALKMASLSENDQNYVAYMIDKLLNDKGE